MYSRAHTFSGSNLALIFKVHKRSLIPKSCHIVNYRTFIDIFWYILWHWHDSMTAWERSVQNELAAFAFTASCIQRVLYVCSTGTTADIVIRAPDESLAPARHRSFRCRSLAAALVYFRRRLAVGATQLVAAAALRTDLCRPARPLFLQL